MIRCIEPGGIGIESLDGDSGAKIGEKSLTLQLGGARRIALLSKFPDFTVVNQIGFEHMPLGH